MGYRRCLKHLSVPRKTKPKVILKIQKRMHPVGIWHREPGAGRGERTDLPFLLAGVTEPPPHRLARDCGPERTGPPLAVSLKASFAFRLMRSSPGYQSLPTSSTMAEVIYRFPE